MVDVQIACRQVLTILKIQQILTISRLLHSRQSCCCISLDSFMVFLKKHTVSHNKYLTIKVTYTGVIGIYSPKPYEATLLLITVFTGTAGQGGTH